MKKKISFLLLLNLVLLSTWALPGFEQYIPDRSGEYVYYRDYTFNRESYVGFLYFNESTIQARYYAPTDMKQQLPENDVSILLSINPDADHMELTGERFLTAVNPKSADVDIVNYLHDLLYDFSSRRISVKEIESRNMKFNQNLSNFGGDVTIYYDCTVPLFNVKTIKGSDGETKFTVCTIGQLNDNYDSSFDNFKGFPIKDIKKSRKHYKKAKPLQVIFNQQHITLDSNWKKIMDNYWLLNDDSMIVLNSMEIPQFENENHKNNSLIRSFIKGTSGTYLNYNTLEITETANRLTIQCETYNPENEKIAINNIILSPNEDKTLLDIFSLTTFKEPWISNLKYYKNILDSYANN